MATKRKRFATIETSLLREPWPADVKLAAVLLLCQMADRWAAERLTATQATRILLTAGDVLNVTGCDSLEAGRAVLERLSKVTSMRPKARENHTEVVWEKVAESQGWGEIDRRRDAASSRNNSGDDARNQGKAEAEQDPNSAPPPSTAQHSTASKTPAAPAEWALKASEALRESVRRRWPGAPVPDALVSWARELERIKAPPDAVKDALRWYVAPALDSDRYLPECRSGRSFREKFDAVLAARKRAEKPAAAPNGSGRPEPGGNAYRPFVPEKREGVSVVSILGELRQAAKP